MGRIRTGDIKKTVSELMVRYPDKFTHEFEHNKKIITEMSITKEKKTRNRIAGYIATRVKIKTRAKNKPVS